MNTEQKIQRLLFEADNTAAKPPVISGNKLIAGIRQKESRRKFRQRIAVNVLSTAAIVAVVCSFWSHKSAVKKQQFADIQQEVDKITLRMDRTLALIHTTLESQKKYDEIIQLKTQLSNYDESGQQFEAQEEATAMTLFLQANRLQEANLTQSAMDYYDRIIKMHPVDPYIQMAQQKIQQIQNSQETQMKGNKS